MGTLTAGLNISLQSLLAEQTAIATTSNNIANVNTPGYSRQRPDFAQTPPVQIGNSLFGTGVQLQQITSLRSAILDLRVNQETQQQGQLSSFLSSAQQIQALFNETTGSGLQTPLTAFFSSLSQLSANPSDLNVRQGVLTAAQNLAGLSHRQQSLDVVQLHKVLLENVLHLTEESMRNQQNLSYVRDATEALSHLQGSPRADVVFLMNPCRVSQVRDIAFAGEVMPQKSTDFYPKLLSGLTVYALD